MKIAQTLNCQDLPSLDIESTLPGKNPPTLSEIEKVARELVEADPQSEPIVES